MIVEVICPSGVTGAHFSQTMWVGLDRLGQRDRLDIAGDMIGAAIAPGPAARIFEHGELLAGEQFGDRRAVLVGRRA